MDSGNRIQPTSVVVTQARQTPKTEFGEHLVNALGNVASLGGSFFHGVTGSQPVVSAAVSGVNSLAAMTANGVVPVGSRGPLASEPSAANVAAAGDGENIQSLMHLQHMQSKEYLGLQNQMQQESREFNAISNVIKVRHDSAKAAINNIR
jgi:hypothetical protein